MKHWFLLAGGTLLLLAGAGGPIARAELAQCIVSQPRPIGCCPGTCADQVPDPGEDCTLPFTNCFADPGCCPGTCGDHVVDPGETCDDGNEFAGDGCSADCTIESDPEFLGPSPYLSAVDSPFDLATVCLEDFEDGALDVPRVSGNADVLAPGPTTDSVDADDEVLDGFGLAGHSYFASSGATGIRFTFDESAPSGLPARAGMAWTDGAGLVTFEAFGPGMVSLGSVGPFDHADGDHDGGTAEDRFYGVYSPGGIAAIELRNTDAGIEVDHLQYEGTSCDPTTTTSSSTNSSTSSSSTTTSSSSSSSTSSSTTSTSTLPPITTLFPDGTKLTIKQRRSGDQRLTLVARGAAIAPDRPCERDGSLVITTRDGTRNEFALDATRWRALKRGRGCRFRSPGLRVTIKSAKALKVVLRTNGSLIPLADDPRPMRATITHGDLRHCVTFGGTASHTPNKRLKITGADPATSCTE